MLPQTPQPEDAGLNRNRTESDHLHTLNTLRDWINTGKLRQGDRAPSVSKLAQQFDITRRSAIAVLEQLEREGLVIPRGRRKPRVIAPRQHAAQHSLAANTITVFTRAQWETFVNYTPGHLIQIEIGVFQAIQDSRLNTMAIDPGIMSDKQWQDLIHSGPKGVISFRSSTMASIPDLMINQFQNAGIPLALFACETQLPRCDTVDTDHEYGSYELTRFLIRRGCRHILPYWELSQLEDAASSVPPWLARRRDGYHKACNESHIAPIEPVRCREQPFVADTREKFEMRVRYAAGNLIVPFRIEPHIDAVMAVTDGQVPVLNDACCILGRTPGRDILITGYDNYWQGADEYQFESTPPAATIDKNNQQIGRELVDLVIARSNRNLDRRPQHRYVKPRLVITGDESG